MKNLIFLSSAIIIFMIKSYCAANCEFKYEEKVDNYPDKLISRIIRSKKNFTINNEAEKLPEKKFFCHNGELIEEFVPLQSRSTFADNDESETSEPEVLCEGKKFKITPKIIKDIWDKTMTVVNLGKVEQSFNIELCENSNQSCNPVMSLPMDYTSKCSQKFIEETVTVLNDDGSDIIRTTAHIPCGCECRMFKPV